MQGARRLSYTAFASDLLPRLAEARCCTEAELVRRIAACQGPSRTATTAPEAVRLADKGNFTGEPLACLCCAMTRLVQNRCTCIAKPTTSRLLQLDCSAIVRLAVISQHMLFHVASASGVAARGGPSTVDERLTLASMTERK